MRKSVSYAYKPRDTKVLAKECKRNEGILAHARGHRLWSEADLARFHSYTEQGLPLKEIAARLSRSMHSIYSLRRDLGLTSSNRRFLDNSEKLYIRDNYGRVPAKEIAQHLSLTVDQVYWSARVQGLQGVCIGENNNLCTVSDDEVELIRTLHDEGLSAYCIAKKMERRYSYVKDVVNYKIRKEPTPEFGNWRSPAARNHLRSHAKDKKC